MLLKILEQFAYFSKLVENSFYIVSPMTTYLCESHSHTKHFIWCDYEVYGWVNEVTSYTDVGKICY